ncbi:MAG: hypothetical protein JO130_05040 [Solirubrobacterales bacterium]|nr:hypothetical protein [Solirubrobacterales bacterium]
MTEDTLTSTGQPTVEDSLGTTGGPSVQERAATLASDRPEIAVGAAFGGGLLLALILKRLGS